MNCRPTGCAAASFSCRLHSATTIIGSGFKPLHKKTHLKNLIPPKEKAVAVGIFGKRSERWKEEQSLEELSTLAITAGADVLQKFLQEKPRRDPAYYCGKGKLEEIKTYCDARGVDVVLFDDPLAPAQIRNVEHVLDRKVLDRTQLILDIFAQRAKTAEGKLQVELAQIDYLLPRLTGKGMELSRLGGGIGTEARVKPNWNLTVAVFANGEAACKSNLNE